MVINHNLSAVNTYRVYKFTNWETKKSMAKLSSGERITQASDDASGLAVSEKMRTQVQGLRQAERNAEDGLSFIQTSEGFLSQFSEILQRIRVLSIQSANGIYTDSDRQLLQLEVSQLIDEVDRVASQAEFNRFKLFLGEFSYKSKTSSMWFHLGPNQFQRERVYIGTMTSSALGLKDNSGILSISTITQANNMIGIVDNALEKVMKQRADLGAYSNRLESNARSLMVAFENVQASESRIRDVDMAEEMVRFTTLQILTQSSTAMLSQANLRSQSVLALLRQLST